MNEAGLTLLKDFEGFRGHPYKDSAGHLTIGYGTLLPLTEAEAVLLMESRLRPTENAVAAAVTVPLTENQHAALASFVYNVGIGAFRRSTLLKKLNAGYHDAVPHELMKWTKAGGHVVKGLVRRREAEVRLWTS